MKLLIIEHDSEDADFLVAALNGQAIDQLELVHVRTLPEALEALGQQQFDALLLDLQLSDGNGMECLDAITATGSEAAVVVLSSQDDEDLAASILNRGAQDYLVKWEGQGRTIVRSIRHSMERKRAELRLSYLAQFDTLTTVPNRTNFNEQLTRAAAHAQREKNPVTLIFLDLDDFKVINDTLGHDVGDDLLREVAGKLQEAVRTGDVVARLGGDEFAVLLEGIGSPRDAEAIAKGLLNVIAQPHSIAGRHVDITASIGVSIYPNDSTDTKLLMKYADIAMYRAKEAGGNTYRFFHERMQLDLLAYHELARDIREAIANDEFHLAFQPKVNVHTKRLQGLEALLRWTSPTRGSVGPGEFIGVAEDSGLIIPLGDWVLNETCKTLRRWISQGLDVVPISVNVSARQFQQANFCEGVAKILASHRLPTNLIELELTEGLVMADVASTHGDLARLNDMGFRIAIDDFGTGYSCLNYLRKFPIDVLKIDQAFIHDIGKSMDGEFIIEAIISLARSLRLETVAEGVEKPEQLNFLMDHGCHVVQGFLTGKPMRASAIEPLLEALESGNTESTAVIRALTGMAG